MVRVKMMTGNEVAVISDRIAYIFDLGGRFKSEDTNFITYMDGAVDLPCVSVLSSSGRVEVGISLQDTFGVAQTSLMSTEALRLLMGAGGVLRMLMKSGVYDNIAYNQMIFVFNSEQAVRNALYTLGVTI